MPEREQAVKQELLDELERHLLSKYISPVQPLKEVAEDAREKLQAMCNMAYEGAFTDTLYIVEVDKLEAAGDVAVLLTPSTPITFELLYEYAEEVNDE